MLKHLEKYVHRNGCNITSESCRLCNVHRVTDRCGNDLCFNALCIEYVNDLFDKVHAFHAYIVKSAEERAYKCCSCSCGEKRLSGGTIGERLYTAKVYFETPDLFAWTAVIVLLSAGFEKLFLLAVDKMAERMGA